MSYMVPFLMPFLVVLAFALGVFCNYAEDRKVIKRLERMNAKALKTVCQLQDENDMLSDALVNHFDSHVCSRVEKEEEWPEFIC